MDRTNLRLVRASQYIQQFRVGIYRRPGKENNIADALSRLQSTTSASAADDLENIDAPYAFFASTGSSTTSVLQVSDDLRERIKTGYDTDTRWTRVITTLKDSDASKDPMKTKLPYKLHEDLLYFTKHDGDFSICLPQHMAGEFFKLVHDDQGHQGFDACWAKLRGLTFYKGAQLLKKYILHCPSCREHAVPRHKPYGSLQPTLTPPIPFHTITIDFVTGLPMSKDGMDCLATITDKFTKRILLVPGKITYTGEEWATAVINALCVADWGIPTVIISDRDPKFVKGFWRGVFALLKTDLLFSTASHAQTDGQSERTNQTAEIAFRHWVAVHRKEDWPTGLPALQLSLNATVKPTTGFSPHFLLYGIDLRAPWNLLQQADPPFDKLVARAEAEHSIAYAAARMKSQYGKKHQEAHFDTGSWVYLKLGDGYNIIANKRLPRKLRQRYVGRFQVLERVGQLAYRLDLPASWLKKGIHPVISVAQLEPAPAGEDPWGRQQPDADLAPTDDPRFPDEERYEVQEILDKEVRTSRGRPRNDGTTKTTTWYLVRWVGQGAKRDEWVKEDDARGCEQLIQEYEERQRR